MLNQGKSWIGEGCRWVRHQDLLMLILMLVVVAGVWGFIELADEVREGATRRLDERVLRAMRDPADLARPLGPGWMEEAVRDISSLGSATVLTLATVAVGGFLVLRGQYAALALLLSAIGGGAVLDLLLKGFFQRPRPSVVPPLARVMTASFPSGHSLLSAVVYLTLGALLTRLVQPLAYKIYILCVALLLALLVGLSRIYLGVHYPTDVLAGWMVGLVWAIFCWVIARYLQQRGQVEKPWGQTK